MVLMKMLSHRLKNGITAYYYKIQAKAEVWIPALERMH